ncbi:uncharacterized protein yc1106_07832 [Curvularia clavata]|uniref:Uncharacterized protein n=1 Tax=Curvularia clavata TaxID=95742 RepID=A0A9Q9DU45_CURCL|nr:uncharacterized protein yc1106_07832 [Curvularia clavata]
MGESMYTAYNVALGQTQGQHNSKSNTDQAERQRRRRAPGPHPSELDVTPVAGSSPQFTAPLCCAWHAFQWIARRPQWGGLTGAVEADIAGRGASVAVGSPLA